MKAAICYEIGKNPLSIEEITLDKLGKGDVKVRMAACAICHSDIHSLRGEHMAPPLPAIPGHELSGYVEEVGEGVTYVKKGDHVIGSIIPEGCGQCYYCSRGFEQFCHKGYMIGKHVDGGYAEYIAVSERNCMLLPPEISFEHGAAMMCSSSTSFHSAPWNFRRASARSLSPRGVVPRRGL